MEDKIKVLMKNLQITREEALEIIADDMEIDKGAKMFELSTDQKKVSKQARLTGTTETEKPRAKREKKVDADKHDIFQTINEAMTDIADNVEVLTQDRELMVYYNDRKFKIVLSVPRK